MELIEYIKSLGSLAQKLTEEEILKAREIQDKMAEILFYSWLDKIKKNNV